MNHGKPRGRHRPTTAHDRIDFGTEPPLCVEGPASSTIDRRCVSMRWYVGTILNALCGAMLMTGAVYAALDGQTFFAATPERAPAVRSAAAINEGGAALRKADRLQRVAEAPAARQVVRISTTVPAGDREVVRTRPFVRVATNLSLSTSELSAQVGPLTTARRLPTDGAAANAPAPEESPAQDDAEVSFASLDLAPLLVRAKITRTLPIEDVSARVREAANWSSTTQAGVASLTGGGDVVRLAYAAEGSVDPYAGLETRIVPENITLLAKTAKEETGGNLWNERTVVVKKGDTAPSLLRDVGASPDDAKAIAAALGPRGRDGGLREGQKLRILLTPSTGAQRVQAIRIIVMGEHAPEFVVALSDTGRYVAVDVQSAETPQSAESDEDAPETAGTVRLYQSIYETALRQQVPRPLVDELIRIYSYDVDFQRKVQPGDSFELLYPGEDEAGEKSEVLFASLTVGGETKRYYRFHTDDDGVVDYYDDTGKSAKKFLVRKPVDGGVMRSAYGWRRHPILGYSKMHTGVDWAAPRGTPIAASGNGTVEKVGWEGGYGKYVRIRHAHGYETAYGHMSAFARGIAAGAKVQQGQVIGYVGSTGLSTGPHVHYEVLVNGRFVDPIRIKLPRGRSLDGAVLAAFEKERGRLDAMMSRPSTQLTDGAAVTGSTRREASRR